MIDQLNILELLAIILAILGTILGGASAGIYKYLSWKIQKESIDQTKIVVKQRNADLYLSIGYNYWFQFSIQHKKNTDNFSVGDKQNHAENLAGLISQALTITRKGLDSCKGLDEDENEEILGLLKNNYAYFVTELSDPIPDGLKKLALAYVKYIEDIQISYPEHIDHWNETVQHVMNRFRVNKPDKKISN